ncbi:uracil-DNA glycosylase-like protein [Trichoderma novae-zelandiae]
MSNLKRKAATIGNETEAKKPKANGSIASFFGAVPKPAGASPVSAPSPAAKFDKAKWVEGLTAEQKELLKLEIETLHDSWLALLKDDVTSKEFLELKKFLNRETAAGKKWFPPKEDVYSWSRHTPFNEVKVVILGQDPYHNVNQAHGMAFSVRPPTPAPPSLRNMYIALKKDYPSFIEPANRGGLLIPWADRGVLMLNTCLTVRAHEANSHANRGWERFTQKVIDLVAQKRTRGVVFMAWGTPASKRVQKVDKQRHLVLLSVHPSPLSASRGFFDCHHFKLANEWLISRYGDDGEIDWALRPGNTTKKIIKEALKDDAKEESDGKEEDESKEPLTEKPKGEATTNGDLKAKKLEPSNDEDDVDTDEEAALEEALKLAEEKIKN